MPSFDQLAPTYRQLWQTAEIRPDRKAGIDAAAQRIMANRPRYETIAAAVRMPWYLVGFLHLRESNCNFGCHLHNGDPLSRKTYHVPAGRPVGPPRNGRTYEFEESAEDALRMMGLDKIGDWPPERQMFEAERFNGFGYLRTSGRSPYVFGGSTEQRPGKYIADGRYDPSHWDVQPGYVAVAKALIAVDPNLMGSAQETIEAVASPKAISDGSETLPTELTEDFVIPAADPPTDMPKGSRKVATADAGTIAAGAGGLSVAGLSVADSLGYAQQAASFVKTYGVEMAVIFAVIAAFGFALFKHFTRQDYAEGRYTPRER